jgi:thiol-disulfide isomerase/thioredoxin
MIAQSSYRNILLVVALLLVGGAIYYLQSNKVNLGDQLAVSVQPRAAAMDKESKTRLYPLAKEITTPDGYINGDKINVSNYIGQKVVLLDFWTYSCINCQRTFPYLNSWYDKYKDQGLEIIGVHTPEFEFEKNYQNVQAAVTKYGIKYPVVLDNDYSTWTAYENHYWPHEYLIDIDGYIVYDHIGEGGYDKTERKIQELLRERSLALGENRLIEGDIAQPALTAENILGSPKSPETYFGASRNEFLGNGRKNVLGPAQFITPPKLQANTLYFDGAWNIANEFAVNESTGAKITYPYSAANVFLVAGSETGAKIKIYKDGLLVGETTITSYGLYPLITNSQGAHTLEIVIDKPGLKAYTLTFG